MLYGFTWIRQGVFLSITELLYGFTRYPTILISIIFLFCFTIHHVFSKPPTQHQIVQNG